MTLNPAQPSLNLSIFAYAVLEADGYDADGTLFLPYGSQYKGVLLPTISTGDNYFNVELQTTPIPLVTKLKYVYVDKVTATYPSTGVLVINANAVSGNGGLLLGDNGNSYSVIYDGTVFNQEEVIITNYITPAGIILTRFNFTVGQSSLIFGEDGVIAQPQLLKPVPIFNYVQFILDYPQFSTLSANKCTNDFIYSAQIMGQVASALFADVQTQYYWLCITLAHILTLETTGMVGRLSDVTQGSESAKFEMKAPGYADYWQSTVYGQRIYQIIQEYLMGGTIVPSAQGAPYMGQSMSVDYGGAGGIFDSYALPAL
jgi:hypothetical protein